MILYYIISYYMFLYYVILYYIISYHIWLEKAYLALVVAPTFYRDGGSFTGEKTLER